MRFFFLTSFVLLLSALSAFSQDTIVVDYNNSPLTKCYFEDRDTSNYFKFNTGANTNIWQIGTPSKTILRASFSLWLAMLTDTAQAYPPNNHSSFEFVTHLKGYINISFWHKYDTDRHGSGGVIEVSTDNGITWINIIDSQEFRAYNFYSRYDTISSNSNKAGFTGSSDWKQSNIGSCFPLPANFYARFRFTFSSGSNPNSREGWMIDNFEFRSADPNQIDSPILDAKVKVYPNPVKESIHLKLEQGLTLQKMSVYDVKGQKIAQSSEKQISCGHWPAGLYFVEIICDEGRFFRKILK